MKIEAYKSNSGKLFETELNAIIEDQKEELLIALDLTQYPITGIYPNKIVELIVNNKIKVLKILNR